MKFTIRVRRGLRLLVAKASAQGGFEAPLSERDRGDLERAIVWVQELPEEEPDSVRPTDTTKGRGVNDAA